MLGNSARRRYSTIALFVTILLAAVPLSRADAAATVHKASIQAMEYSPATLEVDVGDTIIWMNEDSFPHTVTSTKMNLTPAMFRVGVPGSSEHGTRTNIPISVSCIGP